MASGPLLRTGPLRDFNALGSVGNPVFASAPQMRATIRRQLGADVADMLAIPQVNETGDSVDWYAPVQGSVVPWTAASLSERKQALGPLQQARTRLLDLARTLNGQGKAQGDVQVFARLLEHAPQIPDPSHVYLVNGKPVVTFWGFKRLDAPLSDDTIRDLAVGVEPAPTPLPTQPESVVAPPPVVPVARPWWRWLLWLLPLLLLLALILFALRFCQPEIAATLPFSIPGITPERSQADGVPPDAPRYGPDGTLIVPGGVVPGTGVVGEGGTGTGVQVGPDGKPLSPENSGVSTPPPLPEDQKPGDQKQDTQKPEDQKQDTQKPGDQAKDDQKLPSTEKPPVTPPNPQGQKDTQTPPKTPLSIPPEALAKGSTDFLNGRWKSRTSLMDSATGLPLDVEYAFENGKGTATIRRSDGVTCQAPAQAVMKGGVLSIDQLSNPKCADGREFDRSVVQCKPGKDGRAECSGRHADGEGYSVEIGQ